MVWDGRERGGGGAPGDDEFRAAKGALRCVLRRDRQSPVLPKSQVPADQRRRIDERTTPISASFPFAPAVRLWGREAQKEGSAEGAQGALPGGGGQVGPLARGLETGPIQRPVSGLQTISQPAFGQPHAIACSACRVGHDWRAPPGSGKLDGWALDDWLWEARARRRPVNEARNTTNQKRRQHHRARPTNSHRRLHRPTLSFVFLPVHPPLFSSFLPPVVVTTRSRNKNHSEPAGHSTRHPRKPTAAVKLAPASSRGRRGDRDQ